ncbi:hypothetical protein [Chitinophaga filiformis]|uniref:YD repeat-containing protein n=1 Tax=Chitinophaga filiformis TaxID=104663 RepID=A0ABY4HY33_CHIFI|nr:hypothetical protein [Chitinophaga filiformis]UPK67366.1 hypothetical protein MYF79_20710 [Chitinophaga filiformis]
MKVFKLSYALLIVTSLVVFFGCDKKDDNVIRPSVDSIPKDTTYLLTTGYYWMSDSTDYYLYRDSIYYNAKGQIEKVIGNPPFKDDTARSLFYYNDDGTIEKLITEGVKRGYYLNYYLHYDENKRLDRIIAKGNTSGDTCFITYNSQGHVTDITTVGESQGTVGSHLTYFRGDDNQIDSIQCDYGFNQPFALPRRLGLRLQTAVPGIASLENIDRSYLFLLATRLSPNFFLAVTGDFYFQKFLNPTDFSFMNGLRNDYFPTMPADYQYNDMNQPFSHVLSSFPDGRLHTYEYRESIGGVSSVKSSVRLEYTIK